MKTISVYICVLLETGHQLCPGPVSLVKTLANFQGDSSHLIFILTQYYRSKLSHYHLDVFMYSISYNVTKFIAGMFPIIELSYSAHIADTY